MRREDPSLAFGLQVTVPSAHSHTYIGIWAHKHTHTHTHIHAHPNTLAARGETCCNLEGRKQRASLMQRLAGAFDVEPSHSLLAPHTHTRTHLEDDINMHMCAHPDVLMCLFQKKMLKRVQSAWVEATCLLFKAWCIRFESAGSKHAHTLMNHKATAWLNGNKLSPPHLFARFELWCQFPPFAVWFQ